MANKDIRAIYDNGVMIWPATTTTAVVDPASREALNTILGKKEDKPIEITECIPSRLMSINSAEDAVTLSSEEEAQLAPLVTGFTTTGTKFTFYTVPAISIDIADTYAWNVWGLTGWGGQIFYTLILHYIDTEVSGETTRSYWVEQEGKTPVFSETDPTNQPAFINIDMADLVANNGIDYPGEVWYFLPEENDPYPESTFIDSEGRNKRVVLRIRPFEDDNYDWGIEFENPESWYFPIAIELSPLEGDYYPQDGVLHAAGTAEILRGIQLYNGILYCALVYTWEEDNNHNYYIAIHKTEIKGKISEMPAYEDVPVYPTTGDDINTAFGKINRIVQSHEEVTARALLDLNNRIQNLPGGGGGGIQEITWSALKTLRDGGNLTPGQFYRITDYTCTTTQTDTQSAGHLFDIIVLALSETHLSEIAWAEHHSGDTYFSNSNLSAWELKYCLDNDTTRFDWADTTNGRGVIYWMKDEWNNECPYDFKNIQFKRQLTNGSLDTTSGTNIWCYTFNYWNSTTSASEDLAMYNLTSYTQYGYTDYITPCIRNKLGRTAYNHQTTPFANYNIILSNIVFLCTGEITGDSCHDNYFGDQCYNITFGNRCYCNTFKHNCNYITFGNNCNFNNFSERSSLITLGEYCCEISGKENVSNINIANYCRYISIGASCNHITLSKNYTYNLTVGDGNQYITVTSSLTTNFGNGTLEKIYIAPHTNITTVTKTISHNSLGDNFLTTYKPANSVEISV